MTKSRNEELIRRAQANLPKELREWFRNVDGKDDAAWVLNASAAEIEVLRAKVDALTRERDELREAMSGRDAADERTPAKRRADRESLPRELREWYVNVLGKDAAAPTLLAAAVELERLTAENAELRVTLSGRTFDESDMRIDRATWLATDADNAKRHEEWRERSSETVALLREIRDAVKAKFAWPVQPAPFTPFPQQPWGPGTPVWCGPAGLNTVRGDDGTLVSSGTFSDAQRRAAVVDLVREANSPAAQPEVPPMPEEPEILREMRVQCARPPSSVDVRFDVNVPSAAEIVRYIDALKARTFPASECGGGK